ncbi:MAG: YdcF family protein [Chitinispirillaceae bacterium]|nr:YdcF family protein [Chitinispirillaceae bacterium]
MKKMLPRRTLIITMVLLPLLFAAALIFFGIGSWLCVCDPEPQRLDIVFTFAGENARVSYSRDLMEKHSDAHWVLSDFYHLYSRILSRNGFAMDRVSVVDTSSHTFSEVCALADWLRTSKLTADSSRAGTAGRSGKAKLHIGLVSSPYHMRRISIMVRNVFRGTHAQYAFHFLAVPFERYAWGRSDLARWWRSGTTRKYVGSEIGKMMLYWLFMQRQALPAREHENG